MLSADDREELRRMRDALAERIHHYDDQVAYGHLPLDEKHAALSQEFGPDYRETLSSINQMLHEKKHHHRPVPHKHLMLIVALIAVSLVVTLSLGVFSPSLTGQAIQTQLVVSADQPVRLQWTAAQEIRDVKATYTGPGGASLVIEDARGTHTLIESTDTSLLCSGCGITVQPPAMLEVRGQGTFTITQMTVRQKP